MKKGNLVLSRNRFQTVIINPGGENEIQVTVTEIHKGQVKLNFNAPLDIEIVRSELLMNNERKEIE